jgi:hypothetical protein
MARVRFHTALCLIILVLVYSSGCVSKLEYPHELQKSERYQLVIEASAPMSDATFYVPLPVKNGVPMIGDKQLDVNDFSKNGFTIDFIQTLPGYNLSGFYPGDISLAGNNPWYMKVRADVWPPGREEWLAKDKANNLPSPLLFYNTLYPIGNESILLPKLDFTGLNPKILKKNAEYSILVYDIPPYTNKQSGMVYAKYISTNEVAVSINILVEGTNSWRDMDDTAPSNTYIDEISGSIYVKGWNKLPGIFDAGTWNNNFPDLSSPRWQRLIQRNRSSSD